MGEWQEKGPFRIRVVQVSTKDEKSFRESAAPDEVHELMWTTEAPLKSRLRYLLGIVVLTIGLAAGSIAYRMGDSPWSPTIVGGFILVVAMTLERSIRSSSGLRKRRSGSLPVTLRLDPRELAFEDGKEERTFPRARIAVESREGDGRHRAVLVSDGEELVLYESHHGVEVEWLVEQLQEALAR